LAAALNGSIGALTRVALGDGVSPHQIAFMKRGLAFIVLFAFSMVRDEGWQSIMSLRSKWWHFMLLAFLGIFSLYCFETWAFDAASIPLVSFLTCAASGITLCFSVVLLNEQLGATKLAAFAVIGTGVYLIYAFEQSLTGSRPGMVIAVLGGLGYAFFLVASKYFRVGSCSASAPYICSCPRSTPVL
jgi:drug/metabolite transporter, DME family